MTAAAATPLEGGLRLSLRVGLEDLRLQGLRVLGFIRIFGYRV